MRCRFAQLKKIDFTTKINKRYQEDGERPKYIHNGTYTLVGTRHSDGVLGSMVRHVLSFVVLGSMVRHVCRLWSLAVWFVTVVVCTKTARKFKHDRTRSVLLHPLGIKAVETRRVVR